MAEPPYSDIGPFVDKAASEKKWSRIGCVMLLPADTSVGWFTQAIETASEVRFITGGRLSFVQPSNGKKTETTKVQCWSSGIRGRALIAVLPR
jgi:phage N-6-adenine-methyltransferase